MNAQVINLPVGDIYYARRAAAHPDAYDDADLITAYDILSRSPESCDWLRAQDCYRAVRGRGPTVVEDEDAPAVIAWLCGALIVVSLGVLVYLSGPRIDALASRLWGAM